MSTVVEIREGNAVSRQKLAKPVLIAGRGRSADIQLTDPTVSSRHARIKCYRDCFVVEDLNSSNGTLIHGQPIGEPTRVEPGTEVQLGPGGPVLTLGANQVAAGAAASAQATVAQPTSKSSFPWIPILVAASGIFLVGSISLCVMGGGLAFLWSGGGGVVSGRSVSQVLENEEQLNNAVALIIQGFTGENEEGKTQVIPWGTGTGFVVTPDGYVISNRHVVEDIVKFAETAKMIVDIPRQDGTILKVPIQELLAASRKVSNLQAKFWVVLNGREYDAEVIYTSKQFDMCVMKIDATDLPTFRIKQDPELGKGTTVYALGFPGSARVELSDADKAEKIARDMIPHQTVINCFSEDAFDFSITEGIVSKTADKADATWILHDAVVNTGNSGGPLCKPNGTVVGVNTKTNNLENVSFSLSTAQLREEIDQYAPGVQWTSD